MGNSSSSTDELKQTLGPAEPSVVDKMKTGLYNMKEGVVNTFKKKPVQEPLMYKGLGGTRKRKNLKKRVRKGKSKSKSKRVNKS
jgi:hypothetical protein